LQEPSASGGRKHGGRKNNEICSIQILLLSHLSSEHKRKIQRRVETYPFKKSLLLEEKGKSKRMPKCDGKAAAGFPSSCSSYARRFWATFPAQSCEKEVCQKDSSSSCVRGMSNPITHITGILLATDRSWKRKKREKQKLVPYKIYSLRHSQI
jgi:hypothetical protein